MINTDKDLIGNDKKRPVLHLTSSGISCKLQKLSKPNWDKNVVEFHLPKFCSTFKLREYLAGWGPTFEEVSKFTSQEIGEVESELADFCEMDELTDYEELIELENEFGLVHWSLPPEEIAEDLVIYYAEDLFHIDKKKLVKYLIDNHSECKTSWTKR